MTNTNLFWPSCIAMFAGLTAMLTGSVGAVLGVVVFGVAMWVMERRDNERG